MIIKTPDPKKFTCLIAATGDSNKAQIQVSKIRSNGRLNNQFFEMNLEHEISASHLKRFLSFIGGSQIVHFQASDIIDKIDCIVVSSGYAEMDNDFYDASFLLSHLNVTPDFNMSNDLDILAENQGISLPVRLTAKTDPAARMTILHIVWTEILKPALTYADNMAAPSSPRKVSKINLSSHGLPLPAPILTIAQSPAAGWRHTPWGKQEALECALRFVEGSHLDALSAMFRRSPRAIKARLFLDGIIEAERP